MRCSGRAPTACPPRPLADARHRHQKYLQYRLKINLKLIKHDEPVKIRHAALRLKAAI
jgi:hypothetical protein